MQKNIVVIDDSYQLTGNAFDVEAMVSVTVGEMLEKTVRCKWSLRILAMIRQGTNRPGAMTRLMPGLTTKVQSECLKRMVGFGILERVSYPEIPPRVEYYLSPVGNRFVRILDAIDELQHDLNRQTGTN